MKNRLLELAKQRSAEYNLPLDEALRQVEQIERERDNDEE